MGRFLDMADELERHSCHSIEQPKLEIIEPCEKSEKSEKRSNEHLPESTRYPFDQRHLDAIKAGCAVHVWSGVLKEWLWWVCDETVKTKLVEKKNIDRGLIYTLGELAVVVSTGKTADDVRNMHATKKQFNGVIHHADDKPRA